MCVRPLCLEDGGGGFCGKKVGKWNWRFLEVSLALTLLVKCQRMQMSKCIGQTHLVHSVGVPTDS